MQNIHIEQADNGFIVKTFDSAQNDETRAMIGQPTETVYTDAASTLAAITALLTPAAPAPDAPVSTETPSADTE